MNSNSNDLTTVEMWQARTVGLWQQLRAISRGSQRGLSQSTENAVLLAGAVALAGVVLAIVGTFVENKLNGLR